MMSSKHCELSPRYKLIYYPFRGRAELVRFIFAHLNIPYKDERIPVEEWMKRKPDSPFGVIPILEFDDGRTLSGSTGIARLLSEQHGLGGSTTIENAELFSIVDATADAWVEIYAAIYHEKDETRKAMLIRTLHEDYLPDHLARFERRAAVNDSPEGWIWGDKLTYADFATYLLFDYAVENIPGACEKYPTLARQRDNVQQLPTITKWLQHRPLTSI